MLAGLALFFALSGTVVAATKLAKNSIGTAEIKNGTIRGADIAKDALTGAQIDEEQLGVVPRAAAAGAATTAQAAAEAQHAMSATRAGTADRAASSDHAASADHADRASTADQATDASTVGGRRPSDFAEASEVFPIAVKLGAGESKTLIERDGLRFVARCTSGVGTTSGGTADVLTVTLESTVDGASFSSPKNELDGSYGNTLGPSTSESRRVALQQSANTGVKVVRVPTAPVSATSAGGTSIFMGSGGTIRIGFNLYGAVCSISAPVMISSF